MKLKELYSTAIFVLDKKNNKCILRYVFIWNCDAMSWKSSVVYNNKWNWEGISLEECFLS